MKLTEKSWGYEELLYNAESRHGRYCCKLLVYTQPGKASSRHFHRFKHETLVVTSGRFEVQIGDTDPVTATPGNSYVLPPGLYHRIRCIKPGVIVEASTRDDPDDCVRSILSDA